jgi:hypothetical protein
MVPGSIDPLISNELAGMGIAPDAVIPQDDLIYQYDLQTKSLLDLPDNSISVLALDKFMQHLNI